MVEYLEDVNSKELLLVISSAEGVYAKRKESDVTCLQDIDTEHGSMNIKPNLGIVSARSHLIYGKPYMYQIELVGRPLRMTTHNLQEAKGYVRPTIHADSLDELIKATPFRDQYFEFELGQNKLDTPS